ncbi:hypothetical protein BTGOE6_19860 [Bacillus wiedmannii]|nr:hypothetical protein BTGOE6_19860 [Bacillus wiedmannii]
MELESNVKAIVLLEKLIGTGNNSKGWIRK